MNIIFRIEMKGKKEMPGPKMHDIFYKQLKKYLPKDVLTNLQHYDEYSIYSQGHDFFIYYNYWKVWQLNKNIGESLLLQQYDFQEYIYQFLNIAKKYGILQDEQIQLFIGPGYIGHHILDSMLHPLIIFYSGDHVRESKNNTWKHGIIETLLDVYWMKQFEFVDTQNYQIYKDFFYPKNKMDIGLKLVLNESLNLVYGIESGGKKIEKALKQTEQFVRYFKYDPTGRKKKFFDFIDYFVKGSSSFSYCVSVAEAKKYLNEKNQLWVNPKNSDYISEKSVLELYQDALKESAQIITQLFDICKKEMFTREEVYAIIPNKSSDYGLPCKILGRI